MIGERLAHYRILDKLGEGGAAEVYLAEDTRLGRKVAVKLLPETLASDPERLERFEREARLLAALNHPGILTVFSVEESGGRRFLTMELVEGSSLDQLIPEGGLPRERFFDLAIPLADAIAAAHRRGITHRDLKPANIMVSHEGQVKVLDFGLGKWQQHPGQEPEATVGARQTTEGLILGTLPYMAPEQAIGKRCDQRADIFALGVVLYEMAAGRRPFAGDSAAQLISSILRDRPAPVAELRGDLPVELSRLIESCLEKKPELRLASAVVVRKRLDEARRGGEVAAKPLRSVAVLPFADSSPQRDQDYFCEGLAEELITKLNRVENLQVASRTSSFHFGGAGLDIREIGRRLGVDAVLEGSVRKAEDRLRVSAELVAIEDGYSVWSDRYDRHLEDVFEIQDEIAGSIVKALQVALRPVAVPRRPTRVLDAYECYLRARKYFFHYNQRGVELALGMFERASELDANYALAWSGIASCCSYLYANVGHRPGLLERALEASRRALELDPDLAEAWTGRGVALSAADRTAEADKAFTTATRLDPRHFDAHYFYARHCFATGRKDEAIRLYAIASELNRDDYQPLLLMAQSCDDLGRPEDGQAARRRGVRRAERRLQLVPDDTRALYMGANGLVALGEIDKGLDWARRARELAPEEPMLLYNLGCIYSMAGDSDHALDCLQGSLRHGFSFRGWLENDSNLDPIREHPRFQELMTRLEDSLAS